MVFRIRKYFRTLDDMKNIKIPYLMWNHKLLFMIHFIYQRFSVLLRFSSSTAYLTWHLTFAVINRQHYGDELLLLLTQFYPIGPNYYYWQLGDLSFYSRLLPTYGWQKDGGSMRFTELGLFARSILDNYN